jgi:hypothetical protein
MTPLQAGKAECAKPLRDFALSVREARKAFNANRDVAAWLVFYEAKQTAYAKLVAALPQAREVDDFWRYVQNMAPAAWLPVIESEILRVTHAKYRCRDCGALAATYSERRCARCEKARRLETYRKAKERARLKQRMRKCTVCKVSSLNPRCRVCLSCQTASRRARNERYQKSLKDGSVRQVQSKFTREEMSTVCGNRKKRQAREILDSEGVLTGGAVAP